jgi:hypothetical protein
MKLRSIAVMSTARVDKRQPDPKSSDKATLPSYSLGFQSTVPVLHNGFGVKTTSLPRRLSKIPMLKYAHGFELKYKRNSIDLFIPQYIRPRSNLLTTNPQKTPRR